jgi:hypothetical protein
MCSANRMRIAKLGMHLAGGEAESLTYLRKYVWSMKMEIN